MRCLERTLAGKCAKLKPYPSNVTDDVSSVSDAVRFICRLRKEDITDNDNISSSYMSGRRVGKVPDSSTDIVADDKIGDFNITDSYAYFCVDSGGVAIWRRLSLETW